MGRLKHLPAASATTLLAAVLLVATLLTVGLLAAKPSRANELTVISGSYYPPYFQWDDAGKPGSLHGMLPDFLDAFVKAYPGYSFKHVMLTRKRMDLWMSEGRGDIMALNNSLFVTNPDNYLFTEPLWQVSDVVVSRAEAPVEYSTPKDLHGLRVGVRAGNRYGELDGHLEAGSIEGEGIGGVRQMVRMLLLKRLDAIILPRYQVLLHAHENDLDPARFSFADTPVFTVDMCIQVQRKHADLVRDLNQFIEESHKNGMLDGLERLYFDKLR